MPRSALGIAALLLAGCTVPPPEAYTELSSGRPAATRPAGPDARGDACLAQAGRAPALDRPVAAVEEVFCGGWSQPAARVATLRGPADLDQLAAAGAWRQSLEERLACAAPEPAALSDGTPARLLRCTRRAGGWPHLALVTQGAEGPVLADGLPSTLPVIERLARGASAPATAAGPEALQIEAVRLAARAFGSNDVRDYERAMELGRDLNAAEDYPAAENAYRAALAVQDRVLGPDRPDSAAAMVHLALNLSNQRRFREAEVLFRRADRLSPEASDPLSLPRLLHYRGLHALNQGQRPAAAALLARAGTGYAGFVPRGLAAGGGLDAAGAAALSSPTTQAAIIALAEVTRARGTVAARSGDRDAALALNARARTLLRAVNVERPSLTGLSLRTEAAAALAAGNPGRAGDLLVQAAARLGQAAPGQQRSEARTLFLAGQRQLEAGQPNAALASFRAGAAILKARGLSLEPGFVVGYLDALAGVPTEEAQREMFDAAQLAQRGAALRLAAESAARLAEGAGDPRVAEALRRMQDLDRDVRDLFAERDTLGAEAPAAARAALDAAIEARIAARNDAESAAAVAAPGYRQLVLQAVGVAEAAPVLGRDEALVQILLGPTHGYALALRRGGAVLARRVALGEAEAAALVRRVRAGIDTPGGRFDTAAAHALHQALIAPLALAGVARLTVIPDGPLQAIPFALLLEAPTGADALAGAPWLVRRHAIAHATSAQALVTLRARAPASAAPRAYLGFGDFVPATPAQLARRFPAETCAEDALLAASLGPLPGTRAEVQVTARQVGADAGSTVFGAAFTQAALARAALDSARILHLATHALLPGELACVGEPAILVSPAPGAADAGSAFLGSGAVLRLRLDADLVILSACNTAGPDGDAMGESGQALSGLARAFFFAGARGMLVTHWPVLDQAAAITVADTMRRQEAGADSAAALRGAQLLLLEEAGRSLPAFYAHPAIWAGFALIGDGRRAPRPML
jgi:CHAT domain-containing protein